MRRLATILTLGLVLAGCQCGPGKSCHVDADCGEDGRCASVGYCVYTAPTDASVDAGLDGGDDAGLDAGPEPDAGPASASLSAAQLDFGPVGCGSARAQLSLGVTNDGGAPLIFSASVSNSLFEVAGGTTTVAPGQTMQLTVSAHIPATSPPDVAQSGTLTLSTNDPSNPSPAVALAMTSSGLSLTVQPALVSFGVIPLNSDAPQVPLVITNHGNVAATLTIEQPRDTQFTVVNPDDPIHIEPGRTWTSGAVGFTPKKTSASATIATIDALEPVCGGSVMAVSMTGQGTSGSVGLSTTDVFFGTGGRVSCGTTAAAQTLTLSNTSGQQYNWTSVLAKGASSPFSVSPPSGLVPGGGSVTLTLTSAAIPASADTTLDFYGDVLTILTGSADDPGHAITLHQSANGAVLKFDRGSIDFGPVPLSTSANSPLKVQNLGSLAASVTVLSAGSDFTVTPGTSTSAPPGNTAFTATFKPSTAGSQLTSALSLKVTAQDVLCAPLPAAITASGQGTTGKVSFSPVSLDFGTVDCGSTANPAKVTFTNTGQASYTLSASLTKGDAYTVQPTGGAVAAGGTLVLTVTPKPVPASSLTTANLYGDTLQVTTDAAGDTAHLIPLRQTAQGAIFGLSSSSLSFGSVAVGAGASEQFSLTNTGNAPGALTFTPGRPDTFSLGGTYQVPAGGAAQVSATFTPPSAQAFTDSAPLTVSSSTVLCQPLPVAQVSLEGTGANLNVVNVAPTNLTFGQVPCGTQAAAKTLTVSNASVEPLAMTYALGLASPAYDVTGPASIAPGDAGVVTITPRAVPSQADVSADGFADALTITASGSLVNEVHTVALHETAQGAILSFSPTSLSFAALWPLQQTKDFTIANTGNLTASYALRLEPADGGAADFTLGATDTLVSGGSSNAGTVTFAPASVVDLDSHAATVSVSTSTPLCGPLPEPLTLGGGPL